MPTPCPEPDAFLALADQQLSAARRAEVVAHADECASCRAALVEAVRAVPRDPTIEASRDAATGDTLAAGSRSPAADPTGDTLASGPLARTATELRPGDVIDRYVIEGVLGAGGMGVVYAARDPELDRRIAVKLLHPRALGGTSGGDAQARLMREAQAVAKISHANVIAVHDIGTWRPPGADPGARGQVFVAMELVDGWTLRRWVAERPRSCDEILETFLAAARGLAAAHAAGLIHRDIKPDNVLVGRDGRVRVTDFGMARTAAAPEVAPGADRAPTPSSAASVLDAALTQSGALLGTPAYMAPEQHAAGETDARTDQFGFCVALWEALYGARPFAGTDLATLSRAVQAGELRSPPAGARVPARVLRALRRGLATAPAARWPSMNALIDALSPERARTRRRLAAGGVVALAGGAALVLALVGGAGPGAPCRGAERDLAGVWDAPTRDRIRAAFAASGHPEGARIWTQIEPRVDGYATRWVAVRTASCEAARVRRVDSEQVLERKIACLDVQLAGLSTMIRLFERADPAVVAGAHAAAERLQAVERCGNTGEMLAPIALPADPALAAQVLAMQEDLARAVVMADLQRFDEERALIADLEARARQLRYAPIDASVRRLIGGFKFRAGDLVGAETELRAAIARAEAGQVDRIKVEAQLLLVNVLVRQDRFDDAAAAVELARGMVERLGDDPGLAFDLAQTTGMIAFDRDGPAAAVPHFHDAVAMAKRAAGERSMLVAATLALLANAQVAAGQLEAGQATYAQVDALVDELHAGSNHPLRAQSVMARATLAMIQGELPTALALQREGIAMLEHDYPAGHPEVALALAGLGVILELSGDLAGALAAHRRALEIVDATGATTAQLVDELENVGAIALELGQIDDAIAAYARAIPAVEALGESGENQRALVQTGLGRAYVAAGRHRDAVPYLERALAWRVLQPDVPPNQLGGNRFALAQARWSLGERRRARELAAAAEADYARAAAQMAGGNAAMEIAHQRQVARVAEVARWRRAH